MALQPAELALRPQQARHPPPRMSPSRHRVSRAVTRRVTLSDDSVALVFAGMGRNAMLAVMIFPKPNQPPSTRDVLNRPVAVVPKIPIRTTDILLHACASWGRFANCPLWWMVLATARVFSL